MSDEEQRIWRCWLSTTALVPVVLNRELQAEAGLSHSDFSVLVHLTDDPEGRLRITDLARQLTWEKSRLSHHVTRMERRGLVAREQAPDDGRGAFVVITPEGRAAIEKAAPGHVRTVRSLMFDELTSEEVEGLGAVLGKIQARLERD